MTDHTSAPETKAMSGDISAAFEDFAQAFAAFRETNDERLDQIERRMTSDVVTEDKLSRIDKALDEAKSRLDRFALDARRPALGEPDRKAHNAEHKAAFAAYMRTGEAGGLKNLEGKAMSAGSGPDGGYLVPDVVEQEIGRRLAAISPIRALATVRIVSTGAYRTAFAIDGAVSGWSAETGARSQTDAPTLAELSFPAMELYAQPAATQTLLDDAVVDLDRWIADEVEQAFALQEGTAFVTGDGVNKPRGFLDYETVAESAWVWGKLGTVKTGVSGAFAASDPSDILIDLVYALKGGYRQNASFVMNRKTQSAIRKMKDENGHYLWQPPSALGQPATLMSFPLIEAEDMPDIGAGSLSVAFGDFRRGYLVVDRAGVRILRDPYSAKPYVLFYTTKRVGGGVQDFDAIKLLSFAA